MKTIRRDQYDLKEMRGFNIIKMTIKTQGYQN